MRRRFSLVLTELVLLLFAFHQALYAQTGTPTPVPGATGTTGTAEAAPVLLLGQPIATWVALAGGGTTFAFLAGNIRIFIKNVTSIVQTFTDNFPKRLEAKRLREEADTQTIKEANDIFKTLNDSVVSREQTLVKMQENATNQALVLTQQSLLIVQMQQAQFDQQKLHNTEMAAVNKKVEKLEEDGRLAKNEASKWKNLYENAQLVIGELLRRLRIYEPDAQVPEIVSVDASITQS